MEIHEAQHKCLKAGIKVYPQWKGNRMYVAVAIEGQEPKTGTVAHTTATINKAITNTLIHLAGKLEV